MARPLKKGLDYFNIDCIQDDNLTFIEAKHGVQGFGIVIKLWQKIYRNEGYFMSWNEQSSYLFSREIAIDFTIISSVVNTCLLPSIGIFNKQLFDKYQILTSTGIQKRWLKIVTDCKRKEIEIDKKYSLLELTPEETQLTPELTQLTLEVSTQTKGKERKGKNTKEEKEGKIKFSPPLIEDSLNFFLEKAKDWNLKKCELENEKFQNFYQSKNWYVGKNKMTTWKSAISGWIARTNQFNNGESKKELNSKSRGVVTAPGKSFGKL